MNQGTRNQWMPSPHLMFLPHRHQAGWRIVVVLLPLEWMVPLEPMAALLWLLQA